MTEPRPIFGRAPELSEIERFLTRDLTDAEALRIEGEAGVGKTTLWSEAVRLARDAGWRVLSASVAEQESKFAFAALGDLLGDALGDVADLLQSPLRRAIDVALLRSEDLEIHPDRRAVGLATAEAIRHLADPGRLLVAVDDVQWIDAPSAEALAFAIRRLRHVPIAIVGALRLAPGVRDRLDLDRSLPDDRLRRLHVGPLDPVSLQRTLARRTDPAISLALAHRLHEASGGNPFYALELARSIQREGIEPIAGEPLPVPRDLDRLLRSRIRRLSPEARDVLLVAAMSARPTVALVRQVEGPSAAAGLAEAEHEEVIATIGGRIRLAHPLLGSTVYADAPSDRRRSAHRRLSEAVGDRIERAWHLALSMEQPDPSVASVLDEAAEIAESRGAPAVAGELSELAERLTPSDHAEAARERSIATAEWLFEAGDLDRAIARMEDIVARAPAGSAKAEALHRLCHLQWNDVRRVRALVDQALQEAGDHGQPKLLVNLHRAMGWVELWGGDPRLAVHHFDRSLALAETLDDPAEMALCLNGQAYLAFFTGSPTALDLVQRALPLTGPRGIDQYLTHPRRTLGTLLMWSGELDRARIELELDHRQTVERGHLGLLWENLVLVCELEVRAGNWELAERYAADGLEVVTDVLGQQAREVPLWSSALVAAHRGHVDRARTQATEGLALAELHEDRWYVLANGSVLGFLELSLGNAAAAHDHLAPVATLAERMGLREPGIFPFLPDEIEALIVLGELDEAEALLRRLEEQAVARDRALALSGAARCRALLAAARGDLEGAKLGVEQAIAYHARIPQPFDLARTWLVQGQILRRQKRKRPAREVLELALGTFEDLGAPLWADKARLELGRIGGRAPSPEGLTPTEQQVAELVARGMTNRDVAAALFMSEHTVRANLRRIYLKLGLQSRTELAARVRDQGGRDPGGVTGPQT